MLRDVAVASIKRKLAFKTTLDSSIVLDMQEAQEELEKDDFLPFFLKSVPTTMSLTAADPLVLFPTGFLREHEEETIYYLDPEDNNNPVELTKEGNDLLRKVFTGADAGPPQGYAIDATGFRFYPTADQTYTLQLSYMKAADPLTSNIENLWLKHAPKILIGRAGQKTAFSLRDDKARQYFEKMEMEGRRSLISSDTAKETEGRVYSMGGED